MAPQFPQAAALSLEDFRRLGIRPQEYRLTVIRRAAIRSTRMLAEQLLTAPNPQTGLQLSRIATSTYRLLDPRKRQETIHRAFVGRILPQNQSWASESGFYSELSRFGSTVNTIGQIPFERSSLSDAELIEMLDLDLPSKSRSQSKRELALRLSDADLLQATPFSRRVTLWRARSRFGWLSLAGAGLLFGASVSFALHRWNQTESSQAQVGADGLVTSKLQASFAKSPQAIPSPSPVRRDQPSAVVASVPRSQRRLVPDATREQLSDAGTAVAPLYAAQAAGGTSPVDDSMENPTEPNANDRVKDSSSPDRDVALSGVDLPIAASVPEASDIVVLSEGSSREIMAPANPSLRPDATEVPIDLAASTKQQTLPDPFDTELDASAAQDMIAEDTPLAVFGEAPPLPQVPIKGFDKSHRPIAPRFAKPNEASLQAARRELVELMPQLELAIEADNAPLRIAQLASIERQFKKGSPEQWAVHVLIVESAWLVESVSQVEQRLNSLVEIYKVSPQSLLAETFVGASRNVSLPSTRDHLMHNGFRLADQLLLASAARECQQVVEALGPLVSSLPDQQKPLRKYLQDFSESADLIMRHADLVVRANSQPGQLESSDLAVLGRHHCLMLRRWDKGLEWLTHSYDKQIARVARQESMLVGEATADDLKDVASLWLAAAARSDGRSADSMRLHALDLLRRAQPKSSGLTKLEIDRQIDDAIADLPPHLLSARNPGPGSLPGSQWRGQGSPVGLPLF